jgi:hypothetical protein
VKSGRRIRGLTAQALAADAPGIPRDKVTVHHVDGRRFVRRGIPDFVPEARWYRAR